MVFYPNLLSAAASNDDAQHTEHSALDDGKSDKEQNSHDISNELS